MASEKRFIDANALYVEVTEKYHDITAGCYPFNIVAYDMAQLVLKAPTVDAVEVVHGRWVYTEGEYEIDMICSECGWDSDFRTNYCPNCGAKMEGDGNG